MPVQIHQGHATRRVRHPSHYPTPPNQFITNKRRLTSLAHGGRVVGLGDEGASPLKPVHNLGVLVLEPLTQSVLFPLQDVGAAVGQQARGAGAHDRREGLFQPLALLHVDLAGDVGGRVEGPAEAPEDAS